MRKSTLIIAALGTLLFSVPGWAQGFSIGPDGLRIDDGRRYRRDYDDERESRRFRRMCAELRDACRNRDLYGEEGQGNCRRYRRTCG